MPGITNRLCELACCDCVELTFLRQAPDVALLTQTYLNKVSHSPGKHLQAHFSVNAGREL